MKLAHCYLFGGSMDPATIGDILSIGTKLIDKLFTCDEVKKDGC